MLRAGAGVGDGIEADFYPLPKVTNSNLKADFTVEISKTLSFSHQSAEAVSRLSSD